jgi:hypothetical protein
MSIQSPEAFQFGILLLIVSAAVAVVAAAIAFGSRTTILGFIYS